MTELKKKSHDVLERIAVRATRWVGSTHSLLIHTALFMASFILYFCGVDLNKILLTLTTLVSLEAIYLSIFIQMSVNRQARRLYAVARDVDEIQKDVEEIQEDVEGIEKDVEEIQEDVEGIEKDVDEIQEDVEEIQEEHEEIDSDNKKEDVTLSHIQILLSQLAQDVKELKDKQK